MGIGMLLFWGLIIVAIVVLAGGVGAKTGADAPRLRKRTALEILRERYAKGEIDRTEFAEKRRDLEGSGTMSADNPQRASLNAGSMETS